MIHHKGARRWLGLAARAGLLALLGCSATINWHFESRRASQLKRVEDNPDQFHLWATNSQFGFAFTYDPHAADDWLFDSAAVAINQGTGLRPIQSKEVKSNESAFELLSREASR